MTKKELQGKYKEKVQNDYKDPDSFDKEYNKEYYEYYCDLLTNHLEKLKSRPENKDILGVLETISFKYYSDIKEVFYKQHMGIFMFVNDKEKNVFQLKSDQFGFSIKDPNFKRPYYKYVEKHLEKTEDEINKVIQKVIGWRDKTRKDGCGSFLWPVEDFDYSYNPKYNKIRGISSYIEDRVDLTLFEIKEVYENIIEKHCDNDLNKNKLNSCLYKSNMYKFLEAFGNFETFVKVFGFDGNFVRKVGNEWKVVNIFETKIEDLKNEKNIEYLEDNDNDYVKEARKGQKLFTTETEAKDFENMFDNICELIEKRRENFEKDIKK